MNDQQNEFLKIAAPAAQATQTKWSIPASVTIAQAILESGWGQSSLAKQANNFFGIKATANAAPEGYEEFPTTEFVDGRRVSEMAKFARYATPTDGFNAHGFLLAMANRYKPAMAVRTDPKAYAAALQTCGYSTNPKYAALLDELIADYDLTQYDIKPDGPAAAQAAA